MKTKIFALIAALLVIHLTGLKAQTAREISEKSTNAVEFNAMEMLVSLKIYDAKGHVRERSVSTASKEFNRVTKSMIKFTAPADVKGTTMLIFDYKDKADDMWIYMPALRKTRRIVSSEKSKSFMGSEFTNADMSTPNLDDFNFKILGTEDYNGDPCWKIESTCKNEDIEDENGFSKKVAWISKQDYLCHKIEFYDFDGNLFKVQTIDQYKKQSNGKYFAFSMTAENVSNGRKSVMNIEKFQTGSSMAENSFSPTMLGK